MTSRNRLKLQQVRRECYHRATDMTPKEPQQRAGAHSHSFLSNTVFLEIAHRLRKAMRQEESVVLNALIYVVSRLGLEPRALALKGRCSTV